MLNLNNVAKFLINICIGVILGICSISFMMLKEKPILIPVFIVLVLVCNVLPFLLTKNLPNKRLRLCDHGTKCLRIFLVSVTISVVFHIIIAFKILPDKWHYFLLSILLSFVVELIIFWNGMLSIFFSSVQLGVRWRILGVAFGFVPIANIIVLMIMIRRVEKEVSVEMDKHLCNVGRAWEQVCATKYPILFVHGVFFRDTVYFNYWGRIPKELETNGARLFYGEHQSAASIAGSAQELAERIKKIVAETGCEKVNIIAHSKGGLDCRYAISNLGISQYVASLTTINTPHRGCLFADYLLNKIPESAKNQIADTYNSAMRKLGDTNPDFIAAVYDLTSSRCTVLDGEMPVPENIFCQSVGSKLNNTLSGKFPLNFSYLLVKHFDGPNDGLVGENSFSFGEKYTYLTVKGRRGISHGDVIDLNRENLPEFDVREFYVQLVSDLKKRGL